MKDLVLPLSTNEGTIMMSKRRVCLSAALIALMSNVASAETQSFHFRGTVTYGGSMANEGEQVTGTFCYEMHAKPVYRDKNYAAYQVAAPCSISITVGTHSATAEPLSVTVVNNFGGNVEDMIDVYGLAPTVDGTTYTEGSLGFRLASGPGETKVFKNTHLPDSLDVAEFGGMNYGDVLMNGSSNGTLISFVLDSVEVVEDQ